jgi:hypothetical protein
MARGPCTASAIQFNIFEISRVRPTDSAQNAGKAAKALMTAGGCGIFELAAAGNAERLFLFPAPSAGEPLKRNIAV